MTTNPKFKPRNGKRVTEETVEKWKKDALQYLLDHPKETDYHLVSGDTMVLAERHCYGIVVWDLLIRRNATLHPEKL